MSDDGGFDLPADAPEYVDVETFEQILEMDDDDPDREFSQGLVLGFFDQAEATFEDMDKCLKGDDLPQVSSLGHFLKGSSATLGLFKVRDACEKIQHLGALKDETGTHDIKAPEAKKAISGILPKMKEDYAAAEKWLKKYFGVVDAEGEESLDP